MKQGSETQLVKSILQYLGMKGILAWRNNVGGMPWTSKQGKRRLMRFGQPGAPDILGIMPYGRLLAIEAKVGRNKLSPLQESWLERAKEAGAQVIVAYSLDDVMAVI